MGQGAPLLVALIAIPLLINGLGTDRFGVLTLIWLVIGYFNLFDMGLGRALTQLVSEKLGADDEQEIPGLVWTATLMMGVLGLIGTLILLAISPWLVESVINIPEELRTESLRAFMILAICVPIVIITAGLAGVLAAKQRFDLINGLRIPMGIFMYLGPLLVLPFSHSLALVTAFLAFGRVVALIAHMFLCLRVMPILRRMRVFIGSARPLLSFGGWMTVSNIVGPLMVKLDRFMIGAMISVTAVAYYATPYEMITRLWLISAAVVTVLFPAFAMSYLQDRQRTDLLFRRGVKYVFMSMFPITLVILTFSHEGLVLWLGDEFADNSTVVLQWLALGVFVNSLSQVPFALIQGAGKPDLTAKLHLAQLPFYLLAVWLAIEAFGIVGAAVVWFVRVVIDALLLFVLSERFILEGKLLKDSKSVITGILTTIIILVSMFAPMSVLIKGVFIFAALVFFALAAWIFFMTAEEKALVQRPLKLVHAFNK